MNIRLSENEDRMSNYLFFHDFFTKSGIDQYSSRFFHFLIVFILLSQKT